MPTFQCYVSRNAKCQSVLAQYQGDDEACAAFAAWCDGAPDNCAQPDVYFDKRRGVWVVSNGTRTVSVQVLGEVVPVPPARLYRPA